jgi:hypothetical protein
MPPEANYAEKGHRLFLNSFFIPVHVIDYKLARTDYQPT